MTLEELNLDNTEDKEHPYELTEYEWAWLHTTVPSPYDCQYCRHYKDVYGDGERICSLYHCPYRERDFQIRKRKDNGLCSRIGHLLQSQLL